MITERLLASEGRSAATLSRRAFVTMSVGGVTGLALLNKAALAQGAKAPPGQAPTEQPSAFVTIAKDGRTTILCNRPDAEVPPALQAAAIQAAAEAAGLQFVLNPVTHQTLDATRVGAQSAALAAADGPVLAYCASGTRSSIVWSLGQARLQSADAIIAATAKAGYELSGLRDQLEALARG